jgi:G3E family GTPase
MSEAGPIAVTLLTGYLGSGKTTLLSKLLEQPALRDALILVNEFGEIALDHELLYSGSEAVMLLGRGCLCCALQSDLAAQLDDLYTRRMRKELPAFQRIVIETTGLADPAPILQSLVADPMLTALYRLDGVVTTVDGQLGMQELDRHFESVKQAALADRIVLTKTDLAREPELQRLEARLRELNRAAPIVRAARGNIDPQSVLDGGYAAAGRRLEWAEQWVHGRRYLPVPASRSTARSGAHDRRIRSFAYRRTAPVSGVRLWKALEELIERHGEKLLRVKGIVNVQGQDRPRVIHIVQHVLYPVLTLPGWPTAERTTRLVFIVLDLEEVELLAVLQAALPEG